MDIKNNPLISIVVPVYNSEHTISRCIESIINQKYANFECILVDDGSVDNSREVIRLYLLKDTRFNYIYKQNGGPGQARNFGLERCKGSYVTFVDSDDFIHPLFLQRMLSLSIEYNADIVQCALKKTTDSNIHLLQRKSDITLIEGKQKCILDYSMQNNLTNYACGKLYKTKVLVGVQYPILYLSEDKVFIMKGLINTNTACVISDMLYYYYVNPKSLSHEYFSLKRLDEIKAGIILYNLCYDVNRDAAANWASFIVSRSALYFIFLKKYHFDKKHIDYTLSMYRKFYPLSLSSFKYLSLKRYLFIKLFNMYDLSINRMLGYF